RSGQKDALDERPRKGDRDVLERRRVAEHEDAALSVAAQRDDGEITEGLTRLIDIVAEEGVVAVLPVACVREPPARRRNGFGTRAQPQREIGRASCRERV